MFGLLDGGRAPHYASAGQPASGSSGSATGMAGVFGDGTPHYLGAGQPSSDGATGGIFGFLSSLLSGTPPVYLRGPSSGHGGGGGGHGGGHHAAVDAGQPAPAAPQSMPEPAAAPVLKHSQ